MSKRRGEKMPLLDHIKEFRNRLIKSVLAIIIAASIGWIFYQEIVRLLTLPFCDLGKDLTFNRSHSCGPDLDIPTLGFYHTCFTQKRKTNCHCICNNCYATFLNWIFLSLFDSATRS